VIPDTSNRQPSLFLSPVNVPCLPVLQLKRLMLRDGSTAADAQARIDAQLPLSAKEQLAHVVIHNDADLHLLQQQVCVCGGGGGMAAQHSST
jgi:dephospho-CoA kinase